MAAVDDLPLGVPEWTVGDRLRKARLRAGVEREAMAVEIGRTAATIGNYENGVTRAPLLVVRQYALRCRVPFSWLTTGVPPSDVPPNTPATECYDGLAVA